MSTFRSSAGVHQHTNFISLDGLEFKHIGDAPTIYDYVASSPFAFIFDFIAINPVFEISTEDEIKLLRNQVA